MADRPAQICQLEKGKLIDTQQGFADTFNWVAQSMANLQGGENCEVSWTLPDHPTIDVTVSDENGDGGGGGTSGGGVQSITAGSNNQDASLDATNQDWLKYTLDTIDPTTQQQTEVTIPLPYINAVKELTTYTDGSGDRHIKWSNTRNSTQGGPIALGVGFKDAQNRTTGTHTSFNLNSWSDSNVQFYCSGNTIYVSVYYV